MRRFLTLVCLLCVAIPAGISISGCTRNPAGNYCNGLGYGQLDTAVNSITLTPQTTGISLAFGQTIQVAAPTAETCKGVAATVASYTYATTNNQLVDISPTGNICAGTWNRNTGGGIANYTVCNFPNPMPTTKGLSYGTAFVSASANSITSNPVEVYVHPQVTSVTLVGPQACVSQAAAPVNLDVQACTVGANNQQQLLCAPPTVTAANYACPLPTGVTSVPDCTSAIGTLNYSVGTAAVASIATNTASNTVQITAEQPGTTVITASVANGASSAGYFSTCPPRSINVALANGQTTGTITEGIQQDLTTTVYDTNVVDCPPLGCPITGLTLDYQSTDPIDISASSTGAVSATLPGAASVYAVCQPPTCNPAPINEFGLYGTGLSISSNPVTITTPGTASDFVWFGAPGLSQYFVPVELLSGTVGSPNRLPYVPNSMIMDKLGENLYFGSSRELMIYSAASNTLTKQDTTVPGVVLAVSPNNTEVLINDQARQLFYLYSPTTGILATFGGVGNAAAWTPDSKTLYISDNAALNDPPAAAGEPAPLITGHTDTLYVYNVNTGWTTYPLPPSPLPAGTMPALPPGSLPWSSLAPNVAVSNSLQTPALTIPGVGAYLRGGTTVAHTWCPSGTVGNAASITYYPLADTVTAQSDVLSATTNGQHILGAALLNGGVTLSDIGVTIPSTECTETTTTSGTPAVQTETLNPLTIANTLNQAQLTGVSAANVNQVVPSPASNLAFITYNPSSTSSGASLPYYVPGTCTPGTGVTPPTCTAGTASTVPLGGSAAASITAPLTGIFSPDDTMFFVSTAGDNLIHYISVPAVTTTPAKADTQQIAPNLPACTPVSDGGVDPGCILATPTTNPVPATVITVNPRSAT